MKNKNTLMSIFLIIVVFGIFLKYNNPSKIEPKEEGKKQASQGRMYLNKITLTDEQKEKVKNKNDNEIFAFEYNLDDNIKSVQMEFIESDKKEEIKVIETSGFNLEKDENNGILIFIIEEDKLQGGILTNNGGPFMHIFNRNTHDDISKAIVEYQTKAEVVPNKEIVIFEKYEYENNEDAKTPNSKEEKGDKSLIIKVTFKDTII